MRYEPFRMARTEELSEIAHRRAIAAVDWVDSLTEIAELQDTEDKVRLHIKPFSALLTRLQKPYSALWFV